MNDSTSADTLSVASATDSLLDILASDPEFADETPEEMSESVTEPEGEVEPAESDEEEADEFADDDEPDEEPEEPKKSALDDSTEVEIDGERVTLAELKKDRLRHADYTRKTMDLAEQRKAVEAQVAEARGKRDEYAQRLADVEAALAPAVVEPDPALRQNDPAEYAAQWAEYSQRREQLQAVQADRQRIAQEQAVEQAEQHAAKMAAESAKLLEAIPEWQDEAKAGAEKAALVSYLKQTFGATEEEIGRIDDHRWLVSLRKAMLFDEITTKGKEQLTAKIATAPKVLQPGSRDTSPKNARKPVERATMDRLTRTGKADDAAAAILARLSDDD